jgi:hypothetical protein
MRTQVLNARWTVRYESNTDGVAVAKGKEGIRFTLKGQELITEAPLPKDIQKQILRTLGGLAINIKPGEDILLRYGEFAQVAHFIGFEEGTTTIQAKPFGDFISNPKTNWDIQDVIRTWYSSETADRINFAK